MKILAGFLAILPAALLLSVVVADPTTATKKPLKVFLLVGQSNMQGHGIMAKQDKAKKQYLNGTLEWMVETKPQLYGKLKNKDGSWTPRDDVWIAYNRQKIGNVRAEMNQKGPLLPGYGGDPGPQEGSHMGPELSFGWTMGDAFDKKDNQQVLLIKVAWGGRSLAVNYRPPSSGGDTGLYYESMIANTFKTLNNLEEYFPDYAAIGSYELAGFVWHQGWNDGCITNMTNEYEVNLANLIRDVRTDLGVPDLPVSIGVSGMTGYKPSERREAIIAAQFAVANATKYPEFAGTVAAVETRDFHRGPYPESPWNQVYHWNNNCESYWLVGKAMAEAMIKLLKQQGEKKKKQSSSLLRPNSAQTVLVE